MFAIFARHLNELASYERFFIFQRVAQKTPSSQWSNKTRGSIQLTIYNNLDKRLLINFAKNQFLNDEIYSYLYKIKDIWHLAIWQNWCFGQFYHSKIEFLQI